MKFSKILLLLVITLSIVSCKKDDDSPVAFVLSNANLAGTHDLTYYTKNQVITGSVAGSTIIITKNTTADTYQSQITFMEDGTFTFSGEYRTTTTSSQGGDPVVEIVVLNEEGEYFVSNSARTIRIEGGGVLGNSDSNTVTLFNETELRVTYGKTYTENGDEIVETQEFRFVRQ